jgi:hypothetical protein
MDPLPEQPVAMDSQVGATELPQSGAAAVDPPQQQRAAMDFQREASDLPQSVAAAASAAMDSSQQRLAVDPLPQRAAMEPPLQRAAAGMELPQRSPAVDPQRGVMDVPQKQPPPPTAIDPQKAAIDLQREKEEKAAMRRRRQQGVLAGAARFAQLEQALQEIRVNALQVLQTPYYRNCKAARNIRRVGMRVMRELCKQIRSETVLIGKERKHSEKGGDGNAPKRRKIGTPSESKVPASAPAAAPAAPVATTTTTTAADAVVGGSPAGVNFVLVTNNVSATVAEPTPPPQ